MAIHRRADRHLERAAAAVPPRSWRRFAAGYPDVAAAYDALRAACAQAGSLDAATTALVKLAASVGAHASRSVHAHAKKALRCGVPAADLRHVALTALPTIGLPAALDALDWIEESIAEEDERSGGA